MSTECLFVYGTLRPGTGHAMAKFLAGHGRLMAAASMAGRLFDLGPYPAMVEPTQSDHRVKGELYELADAAAVFAVLDRYESSASRPPLFERVLRTALLDTGEERAAWVYLYRGLLQDASAIDDGDFLNR